jgi:hypothetical protein
MQIYDTITSEDVIEKPLKTFKIRLVSGIFRTFGSYFGFFDIVWYMKYTYQSVNI